jgi:hypothetical protein
MGVKCSISIHTMSRNGSLSLNSFPAGRMPAAEGVGHDGDRAPTRRECPAIASLKVNPAVAPLDQARTSKIMLKGVSVARRKRLKPASVATCRSLRSPAWAPSPRPTS